MMLAQFPIVPNSDEDVRFSVDRGRLRHPVNHFRLYCVAPPRSTTENVSEPAKLVASAGHHLRIQLSSRRFDAYSIRIGGHDDNRCRHTFQRGAGATAYASV